MASKSISKKQHHSQPQKTKAVKLFDTAKIAFPLAALLGVLFYYYCQSFSFIQDDSYITFRYVKNFTEGHGLVFNIGEYVEGYTCFLWVIILSLVKQLGFNFISASQTIGTISSVLVILFTFFISSRIFPKIQNNVYNVSFSIIAGILLASNGSFAYWAVSGMETGLFCFLVTAGIYLYLKEIQNAQNTSIKYSSLLFLSATLTRPEGGLIFGITILHKIIITLKIKNDNSQNKFSLLLNKENIIWLGLYAIPALIFMSWRYAYYGYLLPNTFYAKTGFSLQYFSTGFDYVWVFLKGYGLYGILALLALVNLKNKDKFNEYLYLVMVFFIFTIYIASVGGDVLRPNRFFVPVLPVFYILVQEGIHNVINSLLQKKTFAFTGIIILIIVFSFAYTTYKGEKDDLKKFSELENGLVDKMRLAGGWLKNKQAQSGRQLTVAATTIGAISYFSEVTLVDMLGLTDKEIAHNPKPILEISANSEIGWKERHYNADYVLSRKPDYIYFSTGIKPSAYAERGLFTNDEFIKYYYPSYFVIKEYNFTDVIYKRKTDEEAARVNVNSSTNPNYKKSFVNLFTQAMNTQKDKSKLQEALGLFRQSIEQGPPGWGTPYQMMGDVYSQIKDKANAFENYKKAIVLDDYNTIAHYNLYQIYLEKGDTANAKLNLEKIKKYSPEMLNK